MVKNKCYDPDCNEEECFNPEHYNHICFDPDCEDEKCMNEKHYNKQLLKDYQKSTDLSVFDHREKIDYDEDVDISLCGCPDCADDDHDHHHGHNHEHHHHRHDHDHSHEHHHEHEEEHHEESCGCGCDDDDCHDEGNHHEHHEHEHEHDQDYSPNVVGDSYEDPDCGCHDHEHHHHDPDDDDFSICACPDCADDDEHGQEELLAEGKPLIYNRPIQIMVSSGILFIAGHMLEYLSFDMNIVTIIYMIAALIAGYEIAVMAYNSLVKRHTIGPVLLVVIACIASFIIGHGEEGAAVALLYYIAEFLEDYAELRAKRSIKSLVELAPETARVKVDDGVEVRNVDKVKIGEIVIIRPGDKVPLDGNIVYGTSSINQASITGESLPVTKTVGDAIFSGTVNEDGYLEMVVSKEAKDSVISKIVTLVKRSQLNRSTTETLVERISKYYTPLMIVISACVAFIPPLFFGQNLVDWVYKSLSIMVISCPCAFLISTPIGMVSAITSATRKGVLIKGSTYVEEMRNVKAVIFDKTGTLTEGKLALSDINVINDAYSEEEIVRIAASLEHSSSHPIAQAIVDYAVINEISFDEIEDFKNIPGKGIVGTVDGKRYYAANESLIEGSEFNVSREEINSYTSEGKTLVFIGDENGVIAGLTVVDKIRDNAAEVIKDLKDQGVKTIMLTGDNKMAANKVANEIGLDYVYSDLLPEDKLNIVDTIRNKFGDVAMVGDGINDAPALARANIGIAMGAAGSDVAIETADVALMQDDISKLPYLFSLSQKTMNIIKQNISLSIFVKALFVILAILGLITLMMSVGIGDMGLTLVVILNSFRIARVKDPLF
ncbi:MAG: cation-translocating P-type ATPase [Methanobrevibacter ruminantium]|uniref:heavy metal translocating P-type ATPase n=1 Tax=Methanobrevibacter ruminantium TaxID=83816 RepID=UPI002D7E9BBD|nr:cation-translocating P-type ATPase [Methanobrevibacter ruminantium]MCI5737729.1 cation-translocating P-type ATPase [Methanobrevibacter ruminantium]